MKNVSSNILISIIIPVYNTEKYLKKCLDSVYNAIDSDCEVIIINDGSTDNSEKVINKYLKELKNKDFKNNTKYIYKENKGLADTKNVGIEKARGKFISVVDSDDRINENFYKEAKKYLNRYDVIVYDLYIDYEKDSKYNHIVRAKREDIDGNLKTQLIHGAMQGSSCNKIIKKSLYKYKFPINREYEDVAVTPFILVEARSIKYISNPYYIYLQRSNSIVASNKLDQAYYKICENINMVFEENHLNYTKYNELIFEFYYLRIIDNFDLSLRINKGKIKNQINSFIKNNKYVINEITKNVKKEDDLPYLLTRNQKRFEISLFNFLNAGDSRAALTLLKKRRILNYLRRILNCSKDLVKAILGGVYHE